MINNDIVLSLESLINSTEQAIDEIYNENNENLLMVIEKSINNLKENNIENDNKIMLSNKNNNINNIIEVINNDIHVYLDDDFALGFEKYEQINYKLIEIVNTKNINNIYLHPLFLTSFFLFYTNSFIDIINLIKDNYNINSIITSIDFMEIGLDELILYLKTNSELRITSPYVYLCLYMIKVSSSKKLYKFYINELIERDIIDKGILKLLDKDRNFILYPLKNKELK